MHTSCRKELKMSEPVVNPADFHIDAAAIEALFTQAYSTIKFADRPVEKTVLDQVMHLALLAPTWMNTQPLRVTRLSDAQRKLALPSMWDSNVEKIQQAPEVLFLAVDTDFHKFMPQVAGDRPYIVAAQEQYAADVALRSEIAHQSANMQAGYLIMALRAAGLGVRPVGGYTVAETPEEFLRAGEHPLMYLLVGYPAATDSHRPRGPRMPFEEFYRDQRDQAGE